MKKIITLMLSLVLTISMVGCSSKSIATVNGEDISFDYFKTYVNWSKLSYEGYGYTDSVWETAVEETTSSGGTKDSDVTYWEQFKISILENMEQQEAVYQKAKEVGALPEEDEIKASIDNFNQYLESDENVKKQAEEAGINDKFLEYIFSRELAKTSYQTYYNEHTDVDEATIKEEYESFKDTYDKVQASHILISTKDEDGNALSDAEKAKAKKTAETVLSKINKGEDFAALAKEYSADTANAENGGDLGEFTYSDMVEEFSKAAFALEEGQVSGIVETEFGYHIIKLTKKLTNYEAVKDDVKSAILATDYMQEVQSIFEDADIKEDEKLLDSVSYK